MPPGAHVNFAVATFIVQREAKPPQARRFHAKQERELFFWFDNDHFPAIYRIAWLEQGMRRAAFRQFMPHQTVHRGARLPQNIAEK